MCYNIIMEGNNISIHISGNYNKTNLIINSINCHIISDIPYTNIDDILING